MLSVPGGPPDVADPHARELGIDVVDRRGREVGALHRARRWHRSPRQPVRRGEHDNPTHHAATATGPSTGCASAVPRPIRLAVCAGPTTGCIALNRGRVRAPWTFPAPSGRYSPARMPASLERRAVAWWRWRSLRRCRGRARPRWRRRAGVAADSPRTAHGRGRAPSPAVSARARRRSEPDRSRRSRSHRERYQVPSGGGVAGAIVDPNDPNAGRAQSDLEGESLDTTIAGRARAPAQAPGRRLVDDLHRGRPGDHGRDLGGRRRDPSGSRPSGWPTAST